MKKTISLLALTISFSAYAQDLGIVTKQTGFGTGHTHNESWRIATEFTSYVAGGVTFNYPVGYFTNPPCVTVTAQLDGLSFAGTQVVVAEIESNSATQTVVRVFIVEDGGTVSEAGTGDVQVNIFATDVP